MSQGGLYNENAGAPPPSALDGGDALACGPARAACMQIAARVANSPAGRAAQRYATQAGRWAQAHGANAVNWARNAWNAAMGPRVIVQEGKWDYFFGRVTSSPHNTARSLQNLKDLGTLGFDEAAGGREALLRLFEATRSSPEVARHVTQYGVTITRTARVGNVGAIDIKYFYAGGNTNVVPEISSIIPKIF